MLWPVLLPPGDTDGRRVEADLLGRGIFVPGLPGLAFVRDGQQDHVVSNGSDPWLADARKVRAVALANLVRTRPAWQDVRASDGAVVAVVLDGPHAPARILDRRAIVEAARLVGAQEVWLAWTGKERLEVVDAWRAPVAESGDALRARTYGGAPVFVARKGRLHGVLGPAGTTLPLPEPTPDGDDGPAASRGAESAAPGAGGGLLLVLFFVLVGVAAAALALATT